MGGGWGMKKVGPLGGAAPEPFGLVSGEYLACALAVVALVDVATMHRLAGRYGVLAAGPVALRAVTGSGLLVGAGGTREGLKGSSCSGAARSVGAENGGFHKMLVGNAGPTCAGPWVVI